MTTDDNNEKAARLAHKILTETLWPEQLQIEDAMEVVVILAKALVLSNTDDDDADDRAELVEVVQGHFVTALDEINPNFVEHDHHPAHAWIVPPQGLITEPVGFLWSGCSEDAVNVLIGAKLDELREELEAADEETGVVVIDGVEGLAMTDPQWDGEPTIKCSNPTCSNVHDVHLLVAENLFQQAKQEQLSFVASSN